MIPYLNEHDFRRAALSTGGMPLSRDLPPIRAEAAPGTVPVTPASPYGFLFFREPAHSVLKLRGAAYDPLTQTFRNTDGTATFQDIDPGGGGCGGADTSTTTQNYTHSGQDCWATYDDSAIRTDCADVWDPLPPDSDPDS